MCWCAVKKLLTHSLMSGCFFFETRCKCFASSQIWFVNCELSSFSFPRFTLFLVTFVTFSYPSLSYVFPFHRPRNHHKEGKNGCWLLIRDQYIGLPFPGQHEPQKRQWQYSCSDPHRSVSGQPSHSKCSFLYVCFGASATDVRLFLLVLLRL